MTFALLLTAALLALLLSLIGLANVVPQSFETATKADGCWFCPCPVKFAYET